MSPSEKSEVLSQQTATKQELDYSQVSQFLKFDSVRKYFKQANTTLYAEEIDDIPTPQNTKIGSHIGRKHIDKNQLRKLRRIFDQYATMKEPATGEKFMTPDDFLRSVVKADVKKGETVLKPSDRTATTKTDSATLKLLFRLADTNETGNINFSEYVLLFKLLTTPESDFEIAFRAFDTNSDGSISKTDFEKVMLANKDNINVDFDFHCDLMTTFFGRDGKSELSYNQFAQFMKMLQEEIRRQEFFALDKEKKGYITPQQFAQLLTAYASKSKLPPRVQKNIEKLQESYTDDVKITYAEFDAVNRIMGNISSVAIALREAASKTQDGSITKDNFSKVAKAVAGITLSPLEVGIIFKMFGAKYDSTNEEKLVKQDYEEFIDFMKKDTERRQAVLDLWATDRLSPDGKPEELTHWQQIKRNLVNFTLKTIYGGVAGAIGATAVYPIDMVKTRMQNQRKNQGKILYDNAIDCFRKIYRNEGFRGLYRGLVPQLIGVAPEKAIKLVTNDYLRGLFGNPNTNEIYFPLEVLAGCGAGASQVVFTNPLEIVKIRLQVQGEIARETGNAGKSATQIVKELGFSGLYKGASACFARDIPFSGIYFPLYAYLKESFKEEGEKETRPLKLLLAGSIAGGVAASTTTPFDVIKTRLQVEARAGQDTYSGIFDCAKKVYQNEGLIAFSKGVLPRIVRSSPQFGVTLLAYEMIQSFVKPPEDARGTLVGNVPVEEAELEALRNIYEVRTSAFGRLFGKAHVDQPTIVK